MTARSYALLPARPEAGTDWLASRGVRRALARKSVRGTLWSVAGRVSNQVVRIGSMVVLARLLTPADFGVVGMVLAVIGVAFLLQDVGFSSATINRDHVTQQQASNLFWLNCSAGLLIMGLTMVFASALEGFYGDSRIRESTLALALNFALCGATTQHRALLARALAFDALFVIGVASTCATAIVSVVVAWLDGGHWALVAGVLAGTLVSTVGIWCYCDWMPSLPRWGAGTLPMVRFGGDFALYGLLGYVARNLHGLLIGRLWGPSEAGIYGRAATISQLLFTNVVSPVGQVAPAAMSRLGTEPGKFGEYYYKACALVTLAAAPLLFVGLILPAELIVAVLGEPWLPVAPLVLLLSAGLLPQALVHTTGWVFLSKGRSGEMIRWGSFGWVAMIGATILGSNWGLTGIAVAISASSWLLVGPTMWWAFSGTALTLAGALRAMSGPASAALIAGAIAWAALAMSGLEEPWPRLILGCGTFGLVDAVLLLTLFDHRPLLLEILTQLRRRAAPSPPS